MARLKLFFGFFFFLVGSGLAYFLLIMSLDDSYEIVDSASMMIWLGATSMFAILTGMFILSKVGN